MKNRTQKLLALLLLLSAINHQLSTASAQGTAFTYQGQLQNNGAPAGGTYNLTFTLFTTNTGGTAVAGPVTNSAIAVTNGLFTVTMDFGSGPWNGQTNWLEIAVETNGGSSFTTLAPRQQVTPTPYAIYAESAVALANGTAIGMGAGNSISGPATYDSFIGGGQNNSIAADTFWGTYGVIGGGQGNTIQASAGLSVIGGGSYNTIQTNGYWSTIAGGVGNVVTTNGQSATVGGGYGNVVNAGESTIAGGRENAINSYDSAIAGGKMNTNGTLSPYTFIGGGLDNNNSAVFGTIGGGVSNYVFGASGVIGGGNNNYVGGSSAVIGGGAGNVIGNEYAFIGGGDVNYVGGSYSVIGGGFQNYIYPSYSFIGSGNYNNIYANAIYSTIGSGYFNQIVGNAPYSMIGSGLYNAIYGDINDFGTSVVGGGYIDVISSNSWNSFIGGGGQNTIGTNSDHSVIVGGFENTIFGPTEYSAIGGGDDNVIGPDGISGDVTFDSVIGGGYNNTVDEFDSFIGGGQQNFIHGLADHSVIGGGEFNQIIGALTGSAVASVIGGGQGNVIQTNAYFSFIGGGFGNTIQSNTLYAVIPGGSNNVAGGVGSFAAGTSAQAINSGAFVWSDNSSPNPFSSTTPNQFSVRALGGVRLVTGGTGMTLDGNTLGPLGGYLFAYSTTPQIVTPSIFQNVTFTTDAQLNGWISFNASGTQFQCNQTGLYLVQYTAEASFQDSMSMRGELNLTEIPGSQAYVSTTTFGTTTEEISKTFLASIGAGNILTIQYTGNGPSDELIGGGAGTTLPSVSLTITRIQ